MQYRYSLGYKEIADVMIDGNFATGCGAGNWSCPVGGQWSIAANQATFNPAAVLFPSSYNLTNDNDLFTVGKHYRVKLHFGAIDANAYFYVYIGDFACTKTLFQNNNLNEEFDVLCVQGTRFRIKGVAASMTAPVSVLNSVEVIELDWNDPIEQPTGMTKKVFKQSDIIKGLYVTYVENLTFYGDAYDYLLAQFNLDYTKDVPVRIEYNYLGSWADYFYGLIYPSESKWGKHEVICSVEDSVVSKLIRKKINFNFTVTSNQLWAYSFNNRAFIRCYCHDITTGNYPGVTIPGDLNYLYDVFKTLRQLVHLATELEADVACDFLNPPHANSIYLAIAKGINVYVKQTFPYIQNDEGLQISIADLLRNIHCLFCIGMITEIINGVPTLVIKPLDELMDNTSSFTLNNINNTEWVYNPYNNFNTIKGGFSLTSEITNSNDAAKYFITGAEVSEGENNICSDYVEDSILINDAFLSDTSSYKDNVMWIRYRLSGGLFYSLRDVDAGGVGNDYNYDIDYITNFIRHTLTSSLQYYEALIPAVKYDPTGLLMIRVFEFECPLTFLKLATIQLNPLQKIIINGYEDILESYLLELEYDNELQIAKFKVIAT